MIRLTKQSFNRCNISYHFRFEDSYLDFSILWKMPEYKTSDDIQKAIESKIISCLNGMVDELDCLNNGKHLNVQYPEFNLPNKINEVSKFDLDRTANMLLVSSDNLKDALVNFDNRISNCHSFAIYQFACKIYCVVFITKANNYGLGAYSDFCIHANFCAITVEEGKVFVGQLVEGNNTNLYCDDMLGENYNEKEFIQRIQKEYDDYRSYVLNLYNQFV